MTDEDIWYFKYTGYYRVPETLPEYLVNRLNEVVRLIKNNHIEIWFISWKKLRNS